VSRTPVTAEEITDRINAHDPTLWPRTTARAGRFDFLDAPRLLDREGRALERWAATIDESRVVVLGMGPAAGGAGLIGAMRAAFDKPDGREIFLCDTTDPATIAAAPLEDACVVVASSSGSTIETEALFLHALGRVRTNRRIIVIAPGASPLVSRAEELAVGRIFPIEPSIPGAFGLLSLLGGVPAALAGYDLSELIGRAMEIDRREAIGLGIELGTDALDGDRTVSIVTAPEHAPFAHSVAQLFALATGKAGTGLIAVPTAAGEARAKGRAITVEFGSAHEVAAAYFRFELAALAAAHVLDVDPFVAPEIEASRAVMTQILRSDEIERPPLVEADEIPSRLDESIPEGGYVAIDAYLPREHEAATGRLAGRLRAEAGGAAVTADEGARVLHGTGQLHKDGPDGVLVLQLVTRTAAKPVPVPGAPYDFTALCAAQSDADHARLVARHKRVLRVAVDDPAELF